MRHGIFERRSVVIALLLVSGACTERQAGPAAVKNAETEINASAPPVKSQGSKSPDSIDIVKAAMESGDLQNLECRLVSNKGEQSVQFLDIRENTSVKSLLYDPKIFETAEKPTSSTIEIYMNRFKEVVQDREILTAVIRNSDRVLQARERNKDKPTYNTENDFEIRSYRNALQARDSITYCMDVVGDTSGDPTCIEGLNVQTMEYFNLTATPSKKPNQSGSIRYEIALEKELSGPCRKQAEIILR